jgi:Fe-S cluster assembly protein SufD
MSIIEQTLQSLRFRHGYHILFVDGVLRPQETDATQPVGVVHEKNTLRVLADQKIKVPLHLVHVQTEGSSAPSYNVNVLLESGAQVSLTQSFVSWGTAQSPLRLQSDYQIAKNASLTLDQMQQPNSTADERLMVTVHEHAHFGLSQFSYGAANDRHQVEVALTGDSASCRLLALATVRKNCKTEIETLVQHLAPNTATEQIFKSIVAEGAQSTFAGMIHVHKAAQKTAAKQHNHNLLLHEKSVANARPQLRIEADDVKCAHGATVGQINAESLFYLQSRGIPKNEALPMLMLGFAEDILSRFTNLELREQLHNGLQNNFFEDVL